MNQTILPGPRTGRVTVPASKSYAHRFFIAAALSRAPVTIHCRGVCGDIRATLSCLQALGADIREIAPETYKVAPSSPRGESLASCPAGRAAPPCAFSCPWWVLWA